MKNSMVRMKKMLKRKLHFHVNKIRVFSFLVELACLNDYGYQFLMPTLIMIHFGDNELNSKTEVLLKYLAGVQFIVFNLFRFLKQTQRNNRFCHISTHHKRKSPSSPSVRLDPFK